MHKNLVATLLGVTGAVFMVSIADADQAAVAPAGFNWSGFYAGIGGGFGAATYKAKGLSDTALGGRGQFGELTIGYDHMLTDRILLGGFIDTHLGNIGLSSGVTVPGGSQKAGLTNSYGFDAVARLGYVLNGSTLGYILGGYTWERFELKETISAPPAISFSQTEHESYGGFVLGAGMETAIGHDWTIKTEYRYSSYGNIGPGLLGPGEVTPSTHTFHIAANYRFGAEGTGPAIVSPAYDWTGFYLGAAVGAGGITNKLSATFVPVSVHTYIDGYGANGVFGELGVGYDHDFGNLVAGIMVDGNLSGINHGGPITQVDYGFDLLGRAGLKVNPSTLAYVLGGYSWAHFKMDTGVGPSLDWSSGGLTAGGGLETAISTHMTLGLEYRYTQFAKKSLGEVPGVYEAGIQPTSHTMRVGLKYKFN